MSPKKLKKQTDKPAEVMTPEQTTQYVNTKLQCMDERAQAAKTLEEITYSNETQITKLREELKLLKYAKAKHLERFKQRTQRMGIIRIDYDYPPIPGDVDDPDTFEFRTRQVVCPKLTFEMAQEGTYNDVVKANLRNCVLLLEGSGCVGITGDCGFMQAYQELVGDMTNLPVFLSSLMQCSALASAYQESEKILVLTANSEALTPETLSRLLSSCHLKKEVHDRFVIMGCQEGVDGFDAVAKGEKVNASVVRPSLLKKVETFLAKDPQIQAILLECTELPAYADALREKFKLPVFDAVTLIDYFHAARVDNPNF